MKCCSLQRYQRVVVAALFLQACLPSLEDFPKEKNWLAYATPQRNQGSCTTCWIYAPVGLIETQYLIQEDLPQERDTLNLDEFYLQKFMGRTCSGGGGDPRDTLDWIVNHGVPSEPNTLPKQTYFIQGYRELTDESDDVETQQVLLVEALQQGPVSAFLYNYKGVNQMHAVVLVGYENSGDLFIVKNSWGGRNNYLTVQMKDLALYSAVQLSGRITRQTLQGVSSEPLSQ